MPVTTHPSSSGSRNVTVVEIDRKLQTQRRLARKLEAYAGEWVAVRGDAVVAHAKTAHDLSKRADLRAVDRIFRVPSRKTRMLL